MNYFIYDFGFFSRDKKCLQCSKNTYTLTAIVMLGFSIILGKEKFQLYNDDEDDDDDDDDDGGYYYFFLTY